MYSGMQRAGCDLGLLTLRLGIGGMLLGLHGWARLVKAFGYLFLGQQWTFIGLVQRMGFPVPVVFAVASALAESVGAVLLILGLGTRWATLAIGINLGVAVGLELSKHSSVRTACRVPDRHRSHRGCRCRPVFPGCAPQPPPQT